MSSDNAIGTQEAPVEINLDLVSRDSGHISLSYFHTSVILFYMSVCSMWQSKGAKNEAGQPTKFNHLCDNVNSCLVTHDNSLDEVKWMDRQLNG